MRAVFVVVFGVCLLAGITLADEDEDIRRYVAELGHDQIEVRIDAQRQLMGMGRQIVSKLRALDPMEPEIRVRIRAILRHYETLVLTAHIVATRHALGANVEVVITLQNFTRETYLIPIQDGNLTPFSVSFGGAERKLPRADLKFEAPQNTKGSFVPLAPGKFLRARTAILPEDLPQNLPEGRAGIHRIVVWYRSKDPLKVDRAALQEDPDNVTIQGDRAVLKLHSDPIILEIATRSPEELEKALRNADTRTQALVELRLRTDKAALPILRTHAMDPDLRLHAITALGKNAAEADLRLIRTATRDPKAAVRFAATRSLRYFKGRKARVRLCLLAKDAELRTAAVVALRGHKHARTIDTYIEVLRGPYREGPWVPQITTALKEWTGKTVRNTPNEIAAFRRWWKKNREAWIAKNG